MITSYYKDMFKDERARKISQTMKNRKVDNFRFWRAKIDYPRLPTSGDLAEYIGVTLGDGNISRFPRTERIIIVGNANNQGFIARYANLTEILFNKKPTVTKIKASNAFRISLYQKHISERLGIPTGSRKGFPYKIPDWINNNNEYLIRFLRGLFEAEGSLSIHLPTYTYNFAFSNLNPYLLKIVENVLMKLEFHPEIRNNAIRIRKKKKVESLRKLLSFREY